MVSYPVEDIFNEARLINKFITKFFITKTIEFEVEGNIKDTITVGYAKFKTKQSSKSIKLLSDWLKARIKTNKLKLIVE